ncbi:DUF732 domain-containing protein [Pseudonocardia lacus]|uniref:DUF732 domain-containing protein n=1 Tax=Pseudonocardia lacus TaxID=2835865 RepID=UPI001BDCE89D|nr:DUF732 domain-containing protein [Pseudonocardia lacus]
MLLLIAGCGDDVAGAEATDINPPPGTASPTHTVLPVESFTMPDVTGLSGSAAQGRLASELGARNIEYVPAAASRESRVGSQHPPAGTSVRQTDLITLTLRPASAAPDADDVLSPAAREVAQQMYLDMMGDSGFSRGETLDHAAGQYVCSLFDRGEPWREVVRRLVVDEGYEARDGGGLIAYAVALLCPEHRAELPPT